MNPPSRLGQTFNPTAGSKQPSRWVSPFLTQHFFKVYILGVYVYMQFWVNDIL